MPANSVFVAGKGLSVSERIPREVREDLAKRGHDVRTHSAKGLR